MLLVCFGFFLFLMSSFSLLYQVFYVMTIYKIIGRFSSSCRLLSFSLQKLLNSVRSHWLIVGLSAHIVSVLFQKSFLVLMSWCLFPTFSSVRLKAFGLILRSLIHLVLFCLGWQVWIFLHSSTCRHPFWLALCIEDAVSSAVCIFGF